MVADDDEDLGTMLEMLLQAGLTLRDHPATVAVAVQVSTGCGDASTCAGYVTCGIALGKRVL